MGFKILLRSGSEEFVAALESAFEEQSLTLVVPTDLDWSAETDVMELFKSVNPSIFIDCSLKNQNLEREISALANIATQCSSSDIPLIHFSSYRVFGKTVSHGAMEEGITPKPRDELGKRLLKLEQTCAQTKNHIILRLSWMLGGNLDNLFDELIPKLLNGDPVFVSDHDFGSPVNMAFLVNVLLALLQQILCGAENWGIFHVHGSDKCSEAEFCDSLVRILSTELKREVDMPMVAGVDDDRRLLKGNALLDGYRLTDNFGIQLPSWRKGLKSLVHKYLIQHKFLAE